MPAPGAGQVPQPMAGATPPASGSRAPQVPAPSASAQSMFRYGGQAVPAPTQGQVPQPKVGQVPQPMQGATPPARVPMGQQASPQFGQGAPTRASAQFGAPSAPDQALRAAGNPFAPPGQSASEPGTPQASSASRASAPGAPAPGQFTPGFRSFVRSGPSMPGPGTAQYPQAAPQAAQVWVMPEPDKKPLPVFEGVTIGAGAAMMLLGILGAILVAGPLYGMFFAFMCLFPLSIVISFLLFVDRFEPEPWWTKIAAFLWGGGVAIFFAGMSNDFAKLVFSAATDNPAAGEVFAVVVGAPSARNSSRRSASSPSFSCAETTSHPPSMACSTAACPLPASSSSKTSGTSWTRRSTVPSGPPSSCASSWACSVTSCTRP